MIELLTAITLLCQINAAGTSGAFIVNQIQRDCHRYYVKCIGDYKKAHETTGSALEGCILLRK